MSDFLELQTNVPQQVALAYDDGKLVETRFGDKMFFTLVDGRTLSLKPDDAAKIAFNGIAKRQPFCICKREVKMPGERKSRFQIDVWLPGSGEIQPARPSTPPPPPPPPPPASNQPGASVSALAPAQAAAPVNYQNGHSNNGNGSANGGGNGANSRPYQAAAIPAPAVKIPIAQAVIEAVRMVQQAMKETGEQWSDNSRQDLVSTVLITYQREGWLCLRGGAQ